jgi:hypothetical protein
MQYLFVWGKFLLFFVSLSSQPVERTLNVHFVGRVSRKYQPHLALAYHQGRVLQGRIRWGSWQVEEATGHYFFSFKNIENLSEN